MLYEMFKCSIFISPWPHGALQWQLWIERDAGCAQMMCKRCKHVFCWHCLTSLDVSNRNKEQRADIEFSHIRTTSCCVTTTLATAKENSGTAGLPSSGTGLRSQIALKSASRFQFILCNASCWFSLISKLFQFQQVIGIFAGFGILLLIASPVLLVAAPCIICCKCR